MILEEVLGEACGQAEQGCTEKQEQKTEGVELVHRGQDTAPATAHERSGEQEAGEGYAKFVVTLPYGSRLIRVQFSNELGQTVFAAQG